MTKTRDALQFDDLKVLAKYMMDDIKNNLCHHAGSFQQRGEDCFTGLILVTGENKEIEDPTEAIEIYVLDMEKFSSLEMAKGYAKGIAQSIYDIFGDVA